LSSYTRLFYCRTGRFYFVIMMPLLSISSLFPHTTLFRSVTLHPGEREPVRVLLNDLGEAMLPSALHVHTETGLCQSTGAGRLTQDRKSTRLNSSHVKISYAVFCLKKKIGIVKSSSYTRKR